jgi:5-methylthioribose kinase
LAIINDKERVMSHYHTFNSADALNYARQHAGIAAEILTSAEEVGDGNLNLVFKIYDSEGMSRFVVKQALPYVRCVGESWPLTLDRARLEAETLTAHYHHAPEQTVKIIHFDTELAAMVMEDLSDYAILRRSLINGEYWQGVPSLLADYLARVVFFTSDFYLTSAEKKSKLNQYSNPAMCAITESLFFTDPYNGHPSNNYPASLQVEVQHLQQDLALK